MIEISRNVNDIIFGNCIEEVELYDEIYNALNEGYTHEKVMEYLISKGILLDSESLMAAKLKTTHGFSEVVVEGNEPKNYIKISFF